MDGPEPGMLYTQAAFSPFLASLASLANPSLFLLFFPGLVFTLDKDLLQLVLLLQVGSSGIPSFHLVLSFRLQLEESSSSQNTLDLLISVLWGGVKSV